MKLILSLVVSLFFGGASFGATIAYWRFETGPANAAATGGFSILDSSGNGLNGTPFNNPIYRADVPANPVPQTLAPDNFSLDFNGSNQRVYIPDNAKFALTHSFTVEAFFYARSAPAGDARYIVHRGDDRSGNDPYWLGVGTGQVAFAFDDPTGARTFLSTPLPALNQWIHVAGTLDDATGRMSLYVNGVLQAFTTTNLRSAASLTGGSPGIGIGNTPSANFPSWFDGKIDEVRISDVALDPSQFLNAAVPEPTSAVFLGIAGLCLLSRRR